MRLPEFVLTPGRGTAQAQRPLDIGHCTHDWSGVFKGLAHALTILALLTAIGAHWVVLQSVAWTTMLADNLRTNSLSQAVERTFDGEHPCALCKKIAKGKQAEKKSEFPRQLKKFECSFTPSVFMFDRPWLFYEVGTPETVLDPLTHAPPVPPPRTFLS